MKSISEEIDGSTTPSPIRVLVNLNRCQGYAQCCFLAPKVFELHGEEALWYDPTPDPSERERVLRATASCPVQAITLEINESA
jgi:ferredoxin